MKKLTLFLLTVLALAMSAQAGMLRLNSNDHHQLNKNKIAGPCMTQDQANDRCQ